MKIAGFIIIALVLIICLMGAIAESDRNEKVANAIAIICAASILGLVFIINS